MNAFNIITEFRFDIAHAVADSKTLQNQVGLISDTANQALYSLRRVGMGLVMQMGLFSGGVTSFLYNAIQASEKFGQSQRKLANVFLSNQDVLGGQGMSFLEAMKQSEKVMENIRQKAFGFALDPSVLKDQVSAIAPMLLSHKLDDKNLNRSIDISRGLLKSAPTLGIDPGLVQSQLISLVMGRAELQNTLFQRLMSETKPFRENNIVDSKSYNALPAQKRIQILTDALLQFGSNAEVIAGNVNSLTGQMNVFRSMIVGAYSILKPLGDALMKPIIIAFKYVNEWLNTQGRQVIQNLTKLIEGFLEDPVKAYQKLRQLGRLQGDTLFAGKLAFIIEMFHVGAVAIAFMQARMTALYNGIMMVARTVGMFALRFLAMIPVAKILAFTFGILKAVAVALARTLLPLIFFMQIWSSTIAKLETIWASWMMDNAGRMTDVLQRIGNAFNRIMLPITEAINGISDMLSGILGWFVTKEYLVSFFEILAEALEWVAEKIVLALSAISGFGAAIGQMIADIQDMRFSGMGGRMTEAFGSGAWDYYKKVYKISESGETPVSQHVTNIGTVNVNQQFKEQMEPDRIAMAFTDLLKKVSMNPTQSTFSRPSKAGMVGQ